MPKATPETIRKKREQVERSLRYLVLKGKTIEELAQASNLNIQKASESITWNLRESGTRAANTGQEKFDADDKELDHALSALKNIEDSLKTEQRNNYETSSRHSSISSNTSGKSRSSSVSSNSSSSSESEKKSLFGFMRSKSKDMPKVKETHNYEGLKATFQVGLSNHNDVETVKKKAENLKKQPEFIAASKGLSKESLQFAKDLKEIEKEAIAVTEKRININTNPSYGGPT